MMQPSQVWLTFAERLEVSIRCSELPLAWALPSESNALASRGLGNKGLKELA